MRITLSLFFALALSGCFKSSADKAIEQSMTYSITTRPSFGGTVTPSETRVSKGAATQLHVKPDLGYKVKTIDGCNGTLSDLVFTTGAMDKDCVVTIEFASSLPQSFIVEAVISSEHGSVYPQYISTQLGHSAQFLIEPSVGYAAEISGCNGTLAGNYYTTGAISNNCEIDVKFNSTLPDVFVVTTTSNDGGRVIPSILSAQVGTSAQLVIDSNPGFSAAVTGCDGRLEGSIYVTGVITEACTVNAVFTSTLPNSFLVSATSSTDEGTVWPVLASAAENSTVQFFITPKLGRAVDSVIGCPGVLNGNTFTAGPIKNNCDLTIKYKSSLPPIFVVTATASTGGIITPESTSVQQGTSAQFSVEPNPGKAVDAISGCDGAIAGAIYTTGPITENCAITVSFKDSVVVGTSLNYGGDVYPLEYEGVPGSSASFNITPIDGYEVSTVLGCGGTLSGLVYSISNVQNSCVVNIQFSPIQLFTINASSISSGTISPQVATKKKGESQNFTVTPALGYKISTVVGCGGTLTSNSYRVSNIQSSCDVVAAFEKLHPAQNLVATTTEPGVARLTYGYVSGATSHSIFVHTDPNVSPTNHSSVWQNAPNDAYIGGLANVPHYFMVVAYFGSQPNQIAGENSATVSVTPMAFP